MNVGGAVPAAILPTKTNRRAKCASHIFYTVTPRRDVKGNRIVPDFVVVTLPGTRKV